MDEEIEFILDSAKEHMEKTLHHLEHELVKIRAGRANPEMLVDLKVDYYGSLTPLTQVSNLSAPDARTITIQPWEKGLIPEIEKAIINSNLGFNPSNNGDMVIINVPALTEERRRDLAKMARVAAEDSKVGVRSARKEANDEIKKLGTDGLSEDLVKDHEDTIQKMTDGFSVKIDELIKVKEKDIMTL